MLITAFVPTDAVQHTQLFVYTEPLEYGGRMRRSGILVILVCVAISGMVAGQEKAMGTAIESPRANVAHEVVRAPWLDAAQSKLEDELVAKYGEGQRERARRGLKQVGEFWRADDGDQPAFEAFARANFAGDQATLDTTFVRFERLMEQIDGHIQETVPPSLWSR